MLDLTKIIIITQSCLGYRMYRHNALQYNLNHMYNNPFIGVNIRLRDFLELIMNFETIRKTEPSCSISNNTVWTNQSGPVVKFQDVYIDFPHEYHNNVSITLEKFKRRLTRMNNILEHTNKVFFTVLLQNTKDIELFNDYYHKFSKNYIFICMTLPRQSHLVNKADNVHIFLTKAGGVEKQLGIMLLNNYEKLFQLEI